METTGKKNTIIKVAERTRTTILTVDMSERSLASIQILSYFIQNINLKRQHLTNGKAEA